MSIFDGMDGVINHRLFRSRPFRHERIKALRLLANKRAKRQPRKEGGEGHRPPGERRAAHQVPVASGVLDGNRDKKSCVDLVCRTAPGCFDLIELKVGSNHAVYAAMEVLRYGVLYLFSRRFAGELG
jgi:hypothetical protein